MSIGLNFWLKIGAFVGWINSLSFDVILNMIIGIVGAMIGGWLTHILRTSIDSSVAEIIVNAILGAAALLCIWRLIKLT